MQHNRSVTIRKLSVVAVWLATLVASLFAVLLSAEGAHWVNLSLVLGGSVLLCFILQIILSKKEGLVSRVIVSASGSTAIVAVAALVIVVSEYL